MLATVVASTYALMVYSFSFFSGETVSSSAKVVLCAALALLLLPGTGIPRVITVVACTVSALQTYLKVVRIFLPDDGSVAGLDGKVVVVTGSSTGIGEATAARLLGLGATVIFACRSEGRARAAIARACASASDSLGIAPPTERAIFVPLDLASCTSIRECARLVRALPQGRCDALVCNAAAMLPVRSHTAEGWEFNLGCHALGHQLLALLLLPMLRQREGRIVSVSSCLHRKSDPALLLADPMSDKAYGMFSAYERSKLAQVGAVAAERTARTPYRPAVPVLGGSARALTASAADSAPSLHAACFPAPHSRAWPLSRARARVDR